MNKKQRIKALEPRVEALQEGIAELWQRRLKDGEALQKQFAEHSSLIRGLVDTVERLRDSDSAVDRETVENLIHKTNDLHCSIVGQGKRIKETERRIRATESRAEDKE